MAIKYRSNEIMHVRMHRFIGPYLKQWVMLMKNWIINR